MERRSLERSEVSTPVYLTAPGESAIRCLATNLSTRGVFLRVNRLRLQAGTQVSLVFAVEIGDMVRLHRRDAVVSHVDDRGAGLMMQDWVRFSGTDQSARVGDRAGV